ncbi:hypothetical protein [Aeromicrobium sp. UC242_57]
MTVITRLPHPDIDDVALTDVLFALSDPARLDIVRRWRTDRSAWPSAT